MKAARPFPHPPVRLPVLGCMHVRVCVCVYVCMHVCVYVSMHAWCDDVARLPLVREQMAGCSSSVSHFSRARRWSARRMSQSTCLCVRRGVGGSMACKSVAARGKDDQEADMSVYIQGHILRYKYKGHRKKKKPRSAGRCPVAREATYVY